MEMNQSPPKSLSESELDTAEENLTAAIEALRTKGTAGLRAQIAKGMNLPDPATVAHRVPMGGPFSADSSMSILPARSSETPKAKT